MAAGNFRDFLRDVSLAVLDGPLKLGATLGWLSHCLAGVIIRNLEGPAGHYSKVTVSFFHPNDGAAR